MHSICTLGKILYLREGGREGGKEGEGQEGGRERSLKLLFNFQTDYLLRSLSASQHIPCFLEHTPIPSTLKVGFSWE